MQQGDTVQVVGFDKVMKRMLRLSKFCAKTDQAIKAEHRRIARASARRLKRKVTSYNKDINVSDGKGNIREVVPQGTYKRSITAWQPKKQKDNHVFYIGSRTGKTRGQNKDGWFQFIVEQGAQFVQGGSNKNRDVLVNHRKNDGKKVLQQTIEAYKKRFPKLVK